MWRDKKFSALIDDIDSLNEHGECPVWRRYSWSEFFRRYDWIIIIKLNHIRNYSRWQTVLSSKICCCRSTRLDSSELVLQTRQIPHSTGELCTRSSMDTKLTSAEASTPAECPSKRRRRQSQPSSALRPHAEWAQRRSGSSPSHYINQHWNLVRKRAGNALGQRWARIRCTSAEHENIICLFRLNSILLYFLLSLQL